MAAHETRGKTDEHYTPWWVFEALGERFDLDVAAPEGVETCVPAARRLTPTDDGLATPWGTGTFVFCNPPYGHQRTKRAWLSRFFDHGNGIALTPDRTSAPWYGEALERADAHLSVYAKMKFWTVHPKTGVIVRGNGPGCGSTLWAAGDRAVAALHRAASRGIGRLHRTIPVSLVGEPIRQPENGTEVWQQELAAARAFALEPTP